MAEVDALLFEERPAADDDLLAVQRAGDALAGDVLEPLRLGDGQGHFRRLLQDGFRQGMLGRSLRNGGGFHDALRRHAGTRTHAADLGVAEGQGAGLVQHDGVHRAQRLQVEAALDDRPLAGGTANGPQDGQRRARRNAAGPGHDDDRDGGAHVTGDEERQHGTADGEVDQVPGQPVGGLLDRRTGLLGPLHRLDDLAEGGVPPDALGADLDDAGLVDGPGVDAAAGHLLDRQRLAGDRGLVHERVPGHHHAVHRDTSAGLDQHHVAHLDLGSADLLRAAATPDDRLLGQEGRAGL